MAPTILQGTNAADNFVLGRSGVAFGSSPPLGGGAWDTRNIDDDSVIFDLEPGKDIVSLTGTIGDYLIRPTSLPYDLNGYPKYTTSALCVFLTNRSERTIGNRGREANEITTIGFIVMPRAWAGTFDSWIASLGLVPDASFNRRFDGNYYIDSIGKTLRFDGGASPALSSSPGQVTSLTPERSYTITPSAASINEGQPITTTVRTTGVAAGATLFWSLSGTGINASDFSSGALTGSSTVAANGTLTFSHALATEGNESLAIRLFADANRTQQVGATATVSVVDTSKAPATHAIAPYLDGRGISEILYTNSDVVTGLPVMNLDGDSKVSITDSLLLMRSLLGTFPADKLVSGLSSSISADGARQRFQQIANQPNALFGGKSLLDVDGDSEITIFGDALIIGHYIHNEGNIDRPFVPDLVKRSGREIADIHQQLQAVVGF